jgi:hypothetical protein
MIVTVRTAADFSASTVVGNGGEVKTKVIIHDDYKNREWWEYK